ncbi:MAG TPA: glycoside hydrolase TIM-barrel-like domain-containing protein [Methylocella sp.]|nr:glycoside hydrolase TIM-barrel-like domain-containing protein [Methylocella sp.]
MSYFQTLLKLNGVSLLPATGEFTYDSIPYQGQRVGGALTGINTYADGGPPNSTTTDLEISISQLLSSFILRPNPGAIQTVAIVCAWFGNSTDLTQCKIYPATTYINGAFTKWTGSAWAADHWQVSSLNEKSSGLVSISQTNGAFNYGGTPSDQSIVRCIQYLKGRELRVVFYPFILMDNGDKAWRGRIGYSGADVSSAASTAVSNFLGTAVTSQFTRDMTNLTVAYSGSSTDFTYRRMILHYANLCIIAGGVDLFLIGSELRGLEQIRGPSWVPSGSGSPPTWDYPFVNGLITLADDVRSVFDGAGYTKDTTNLHNLVSYAADWSSWTGIKHDSANPPSGVPNGAQWPHLDQLWSHGNIDLVAFDNYLPLSDWTTGGGGLDVLNWSAPKPTSWPPGPSTMSGLGLSGPPSIYSKAYLKANIEGGERFNWFYFDSNNDGRGLDPNGSGQQVSLPEGDRLTQSRNQFYANQQILGQKQIRWWWNNQHYALWDAGTGAGLVPQGSATGWVPNSKSITFTEYGFPSNDKCTNQPNLFYSAGSVESGTAYWSVWLPQDGGGYAPRQDMPLQLIALQSFYEYWFSDTPSNNETVGGVIMIQPAFCSVWNWDARPFPTFPINTDAWGDAVNWASGNWLNGKGPYLSIPTPDAPPMPSIPVGTFPSLAGLGWPVHKRPTFSTRIASHVSGREVRNPLYAVTLYEFEVTVEGLDSNGTWSTLGVNALQEIMALYLLCQGQANTFLYTDPTDNVQSIPIAASPATGDGTNTFFTVQRQIGAGAFTETEPVSWINMGGTTNVYVNGAPQLSSAYTIYANYITFATPPASGAAVTTSCSYQFNCRFLDDQMDFENFMSGLWRVQSIKFKSVRL